MKKRIKNNPVAIADPLATFHSSLGLTKIVTQASLTTVNNTMMTVYRQYTKNICAAFQPSTQTP